MRGFFYPQSVAVIGVSPRKTNLGRAITVNLIEHQYGGRILLVGPSGGHVYGHRVHPSLDEVQEPVDAAVILTPAATVPGLVQACGQKGIKRIIIESGGFGEYDKNRHDLEKQMLAAAEKYGLRFIGPNGIGVISLENGFVVPFPRISTSLKPGEISIIAQSGGVGLTYVNFLNSERIGISKFTSVGNKLNVTENDLLEYLIEDETTRVICLYLESLTDGRRLMDLARTTDKPILIHKSNTSPASARIAASHTAALSTDEAVVDAAFKQAGIIRVRETRDMVNYLKMLTKPRLKGRRIGIVSRSGGHAVIAADACSARGLSLPQFPREFLDQFEKHFRGGVIKIQNPIDLGDLFDFTVYTSIAEAILARDEVDGLLFAHGYRGAETPQSRKFIDAVAETVSRFGKPLALCLLVEEEEMAHVKTQFDFPVFTSPEEAAACLKVSLEVYENGLKKRPGRRPDWDLDQDKIKALLSAERPGLDLSLKLIQAAGIPAAPWKTASSRAEAVEAALEIGFPVALKAGSSEVSHKSDFGGVILDLADEAALEAGLEKLSRNLAQAGQARPWPVVVQKMVPQGEEIILGGRQDPVFGPVVLLGLGGILVEVLGDVALRVAPLDKAEAAVMIGDLKTGRIL
ncbi:MAG: acetate--CoA ligase family protein, partial [Deltaproteobacteria bacterium]|nr:acetate--CoA ligase family protein [Deltaproteobacteria bacterium]